MEMHGCFGKAARTSAAPNPRATRRLYRELKRLPAIEGVNAIRENKQKLVDILVEQMLADVATPDAVRGFVSSATLLERLPWETPYPADNNLKQLVRRLRRALTAEGIDKPIESQQGIR